MSINPTIVTPIVNVLLSLLPVELAKEFIDKGLDSIENAVAKSETKWDDALLIPIMNKLRDAVSVPDSGKYADNVESTE